MTLILYKMANTQTHQISENNYNFNHKHDVTSEPDRIGTIHELG